jgi:hypothetical protein
MEAYVLNLAKRTDRWAAIQAAFKDTGLTLNRIDAIEHTNGHYGCAMSFMKALQMAKDKNMPSILILEDDCLPGDNFKERWPRMKKWLDEHPDEWEIFNGGGSVVGDCTLYKCPEEDICFFKTTGMWHAHFIYIPARNYDKVLAYPDKDTDKTTILVDQWLNQSFNTLSTYPFIGKTQNGFSNIQELDRTNIIGNFERSSEKYKKAIEEAKSKKGGTRGRRRRRRRRISKKKKTRKITRSA